MNPNFSTKSPVHETISCVQGFEVKRRMERFPLFVNLPFAELWPSFVAWVSINNRISTIISNVFHPDCIGSLF